MLKGPVAGLAFPRLLRNSRSSNQYCGAGAATFRVEPEPIFLLAGAGAAFLKAAPAASFWQAKKESLVLLQNMT